MKPTIDNKSKSILRSLVSGNRFEQKKYDFGGVGLGIVVALDKSCECGLALCSRNLSRSDPVPVNSPANLSRFRGGLEELENESLEDYTIVTCHGPNKTYTKVYFDGDEYGRRGVRKHSAVKNVDTDKWRWMSVKKNAVLKLQHLLIERRSGLLAAKAPNHHRTKSPLLCRLTDSSLRRDSRSCSLREFEIGARKPRWVTAQRAVRKRWWVMAQRVAREVTDERTFCSIVVRRFCGKRTRPVFAVEEANAVVQEENQTGASNL
ncbi:FLZ-type domain-containing protein [Forsythia ovata]|uniref:FLZ-type domain-containing protein n=1 Tax=Forsythia ovata TaxID=205694 RepID=A0ABD1WVM6_9LAMI